MIAATPAMISATRATPPRIHAQTAALDFAFAAAVVVVTCAVVVVTLAVVVVASAVVVVTGSVVVVIGVLVVGATDVEVVVGSTAPAGLAIAKATPKRAAEQSVVRIEVGARMVDESSGKEHAPIRAYEVASSYASGALLEFQAPQIVGGH
jgi:hypothetical protein